MTEKMTIANAEDAYLEGKANFEQFMAEFQVSWFKPQVDTAKKLFWMKQPEHVKDKLRQLAPGGSKELDDLMIGGTNG